MKVYVAPIPQKQKDFLTACLHGSLSPYPEGEKGRVSEETSCPQRIPSALLLLSLLCNQKPLPALAVVHLVTKGHLPIPCICE